MTNKKLWFLFRLAIATLSLVLAGCSASNSDGDNGGGDDGGIVDPDLQIATCEGCHTNQDMLIATAIPDEDPPESEGEG